MVRSRVKWINHLTPFFCGRGNPAPTLTLSAYGAFEPIRGLFIFVKVGARFPRPISAFYFCEGINFACHLYYSGYKISTILVWNLFFSWWPNKPGEWPGKNQEWQDSRCKWSSRSSFNPGNPGSDIIYYRSRYFKIQQYSNLHICTHRPSSLLYIGFLPDLPIPALKVSTHARMLRLRQALP